MTMKKQDADDGEYEVVLRGRCAAGAAAAAAAAAAADAANAVEATKMTLRPLRRRVYTCDK